MFAHPPNGSYHSWNRLMLRSFCVLGFAIFVVGWLILLGHFSLSKIEQADGITGKLILEGKVELYEPNIPEISKPTGIKSESLLIHGSVESTNLTDNNDIKH